MGTPYRVKANYRKANWIAAHMLKGTDPDDVLDVLLGNITNPSEFVAEVETYSREYDEDYEGHTVQLRKIHD